jgi:hypothetical protein
MPIVSSCSVFDDVAEHFLATKLNMIFSVIISKGKGGVMCPSPSPQEPVPHIDRCPALYVVQEHAPKNRRS